MGFKSDLVVKLVDDTGNDGQGDWELMAPLDYESNEGFKFTVPIGFRTDFASVPRVVLAYLLAGNTAHRAATLHDYLCRTGIVKRRLADDLFYEAMLSVGMPKWRAAIMHIAVRSYSDSLK